VKPEVDYKPEVKKIHINSNNNNNKENGNKLQY
jgi:hypothetical protein